MKSRKELHSNTEHIHPWDQVFSDDELVAEYFKLYDDKILMGIVHRRKVKGKWIETKTVYDYEAF